MKKFRFKKFFAVFLAMIMLAAAPMTVLAAEGEEASPFTDVKDSDWFYDAVTELYDWGVIHGKTETSFVPYAKITRAEFCVLMYNFCKDYYDQTSAPTYQAVFKDVPKGAWYTDAIMFCYNHGFIKGYTSGSKAGSFGVTDLITREQIAIILFAAEEKYYETDVSKYQSDITGFIDYKSVSSWAYRAMEYAVAYGVIGGKKTSAGTRLDPQSTASRAEVAVILYRWD